MGGKTVQKYNLIEDENSEEESKPYILNGSYVEISDKKEDKN